MLNFHDRFFWRVAGMPVESFTAFACDHLATRTLGLLYADNTRDQLDPAWSALNNDFTAWTGKMRTRLATQCADDDFQRAVGYSSPAAAQSLQSLPRDRPGRNSAGKRKELLAMRYLQRFATKCETAANVGPVIPGSLVQAAGHPIDYTLRPASYIPQPFLSTRHVEELLWLVRSVLPVVERTRVRTASGVVVVDDHRVAHVRHGIIEVGTFGVELLKAAQQPATLGVLSHNWPGKSIHDVAQAAFALQRLRLMFDDFADLHVSNRPLDQLRQALERLGVELPTTLANYLTVLDRTVGLWLSSDATERLELLRSVDEWRFNLGLPATSAANFFGDHLPVTEDGRSAESHLNLDVNWAAPLLAQIEQAILDQLVVDATRKRHRERLRDELAERRSIPLAEIAHGTGWSDRPDDRPDRGPVVTSPDVMLVGSDISSMAGGDVEVVLSELHAGLGCAGFPVRVLEDETSWLTDISDFLVRQLAPSHPVIETLAPRNKTWYLGTLPGVLYLESEMPAPDGADVVSLAATEVGLDQNGRLCLRTMGSQETLVVLPYGGPHRDSPSPIDWFRSPFFQRRRRVGDRTTVGQVVTHRRSFLIGDERLPASTIDQFGSFVWCQALRAAHDLPRWMFIHASTETKPICIDLSNPWSCEELIRQLRVAPDLYAEEMYPSPAHAWAHSDRGSHLSELRLLYARGDFP